MTQIIKRKFLCEHRCPALMEALKAVSPTQLNRMVYCRKAVSDSILIAISARTKKQQEATGANTNQGIFSSGYFKLIRLKPTPWEVALVVFTFLWLTPTKYGNVKAERLMAGDREVNRGIVNADFQLSFAGIETTRGVPATSEKHHPWAKAKLDGFDHRISFNRRIRIDFELRNCALKNPESDGNKFRYRLFSVKWPVLSVVEMDKKDDRARFTTVTNFEGINTNVLIEGEGNFFLDNAYVTDRYDVTLETEHPLERFEDPNVVILVLNKIDEIDVGIVSPHRFSEDRTFIVRGHCIFGGALTESIRTSKWYPFDSYSARIGLQFPFEETDLNVAAEPSEEFKIGLDYEVPDPLRNRKLAGSEIGDVKIRITRPKIAKHFMGPLFVLFVNLAIYLIKPFESSILLRSLVYLGSLICLGFSTLPAPGIICWYPLRVVFFFLTLNGIALKEYLGYLMRWQR